MMGADVFVDTSALYAALDRSDAAHEAAARGWASLLDRVSVGEICATTHDGIVIEATALTQRRIGIDGVRVLHDRLLPVLEVHWVTAALHERAFAALLGADRRDISLVDWTSFELMRREAVDQAFAFDSDFTDQGFMLYTP
jgi:predicted nucleic acid-binding protein